MSANTFFICGHIWLVGSILHSDTPTKLALLFVAAFAFFGAYLVLRENTDKED